MTRKQAIRHERQLKARGVYKPYVSADEKTLAIESYPLTAYVREGFDAENGPTSEVTVRDYSLERMGQDGVIATARVFLGQDVLSIVAQLLMDFHGPAYERAAQQDRDAINIHHAVQQAERYGFA